MIPGRLEAECGTEYPPEAFDHASRFLGARSEPSTDSSSSIPPDFVPPAKELAQEESSLDGMLSGFGGGEDVRKRAWGFRVV